ncbi:MAG: hypothetical protein JWQ68_1970 [Cryobacterium sp.]|jgi:hypothetical protein|nr:hypothetical protein [Cryobacterium sp.]
MSDNLARVAGSDFGGLDAASQHDRERRHIEIVASPGLRRARPRVFYALTALAGMGAIVVAQLLLSVGISQGAYELSSLQDERVELGRTADSVSQDVVRVSSPQSLAANAEALGMVSNSNPVYLRLSDGAVLGAPVSASGPAGKTAALVPNALLTGMPLVTELPPPAATPASTPGTGVAGAQPATASVVSPVASAPVAAPVHSGLPSPTTR